MSTTPPIHTGTVCGAPVRFFRSPINDGRPDFAWCALNDILAAYGARPEMAEWCRREIRKDFPQTATIATAEGIAVIVPHGAALAVIEAEDELRGVTTIWGFVRAAHEAYALLAPDASLETIVAAACRWGAVA